MTDLRKPDLGEGKPLPSDERVIYLLPQGDAFEADNAIDLQQWLRFLRANRWVITLIALLVTTAGLTYALLAPSWFRAQVVMLPTQQDATQGLASQLSQFGGLASLAGLNLNSTNKAEPVAVLQSKTFSREFIQEERLLEVILADRWDSSAKRWKGRGKPPPDIRDAVEYFNKHVRSVDEDRKTGLVTLTVDWHDPQVAASWANKMSQRLNAQMRNRALADAGNNLAFLQKEMAATPVVSLQQSIGRMIEAELQKLMLARGNREFAFRIVDEAQVPKRRISPRRTLIVSASLMLGLVLGIGFALLRRRYRQAPRTVGEF